MQLQYSETALAFTPCHSLLSIIKRSKKRNFGIRCQFLCIFYRWGLGSRLRSGFSMLVYGSTVQQSSSEPIARAIVRMPRGIALSRNSDVRQVRSENQLDCSTVSRNCPRRRSTISRNRTFKSCKWAKTQSGHSLRSPSMSRIRTKQPDSGAAPRQVGQDLQIIPQHKKVSANSFRG